MRHPSSRLDESVHTEGADPYPSYVPTSVGWSVWSTRVGLFVPVPLSNVPPAAIIALIAFAYVEEDGLLLFIALVAALAVVCVVGGLMWQTLGMTGWVPRIL